MVSGSADAAKKGVFGAVKNRDVFAGASTDGSTASPKIPFFGRGCARSGL